MKPCLQIAYINFRVEVANLLTLVNYYRPMKLKVLYHQHVSPKRQESLSEGLAHTHTQAHKHTQTHTHTHTHTHRHT